MEVRLTEYDDVTIPGQSSGDFDDRVSEWELGLPNLDDLTPLSQSLMSAEMLSAFSITPEPYRNMTDVNRASQSTFSDLGAHTDPGSGTTDLSQLGKGKGSGDGNGNGDGDGEVNGEGEGDVDDVAGRVAKRARLVWTPQLHKRFVEVVAHLGVTKAVPKTIMNLMNVEGLSRENVASHLQKYRLYLKRMGVSNSDNNVNVNDSGSTVPMPYHPQMMPMQPYPQMVQNGGYNQYNGMMMQQRDWSGNNFGSVSAYQHRMTPSDK